MKMKLKKKTGRVKAERLDLSAEIKELSEYSQMLDLDIDEFTGKIRDEVCSKLQASAAAERNDKESVAKALLAYHPVVAHLITEYRRTKVRWSVAQLEFEKAESEAIGYARESCPGKATEKQIKLVAYETDENLYTQREAVETLEQKMKTIHDHTKAAEGYLSSAQTASKLMGVEWEASKNDG